MKLSKLLDIFQQKDLVIDEAAMEQEFALLRYYAPLMFPSKSENNWRVAKIQFGDSGLNNVLTDENLPFHTRDNLWLARDLSTLAKFMAKWEKRQQKTKQKQQEIPTIEIELPKINFDHVQKFVATDKTFDQARNEYEEDLVRAQINYMMHDNEPNGLLMGTAYNPANKRFMVVPTYHPVLSRQEFNADKKFRQGVVDAMNKLGIDEFSIEAGLEKNADLWREQMMSNAYYNQYPLHTSGQNKVIDRAGWYDVARVEREGFKTAWLRQREYQYYQEHKLIIDKLGLATQNMKMDANELKKIEEQIALWENRYQAFTQTTQNENTQEM